MPKQNDGAPSSLYEELMRATAQNNPSALREKLNQARDEGKLDDNLLRLALQNSAKRGHEAVARVLLENGAKTDITGDKGSPALFWAVSQPQTKGHLAVARLLLYGEYADCPADMEWRDENGSTIFMSAACKGHKDALTLLLDAGANVNARDKAGRTILHALAADTADKKDKKEKKDKKLRWDEEVVDMLLDRPIDLDVRDNKSRTPLHWACVLGKTELVEQLLTRKRHAKPSINLTTARGKTALHLACDADPPNPATVELLLRHGADPAIRSDGHFTCLHNTTSVQNSVEIVKLIVARDKSLINATTSPGFTPLHFAAFAGSIDTVEYLLSLPETKLNPKDSFYTTPLIRAAQEGHTNIVERLAPFNNINRLSQFALHACQGFDATVVDFRAGDRNNLVQKRSVFEVLYGKEENGEPVITTMVQKVRGKSKTAGKPGSKVDPRPPRFRWIHLPANNMAWVEALVAKHFVESGAADIEGFKSVERAFSQQHRGPKFHSHFMRPLCHRSARGTSTSEKMQPHGPVETAIRASAASGNGRAADIASSPERLSRRPSFQPGYANPQPRGRREADLVEDPAEAAAQESPPYANGAPPGPRSPQHFDPSAQPSPSRGDQPRRGQNRRRRRGTMRLSDGTTGSDPLDSTIIQPIARTDSIAMTEASVRSSGSNTKANAQAGSNITFFMPYLHFETDERRRKMSEAVRNAETLIQGNHKRMPKSFDETLIWAHLHSSTGLHMRRTLDQFYLHGIDTEQRDQDQVVYRYCRDKGKEVKLFMVDQLWLWILGPGLIITAFPQRWEQPKNDPLNVLDGVIEDLNSKIGDSVQSVYDLALLISGRCSGSFDRHRPGDEDFQFLDMFESSIGNVNNRETALYNDFYEASALIHTWLSSNQGTWKGGTYYKAQAYDEYPDDVNRFIDIGEETRLLQEIKDIRDELNMISMCLNQQRNTLPALCDAICEDTGKAHNHGKTREVKRKIEEQKKIVEVNIAELSRMSKLAYNIEESLVNLLDLKQKQSNALEARFARDQAQGTVRQGQIIMIFTMVTILFLPMSFMAAFFAINIKEFPHDHGSGNQELGLGWVLKYLLGIGLGISVLFIALAFNLNTLSTLAQYIQAPFLARKKKNAGASLGSSIASEAKLSVAEIYGLPRMSKDVRRSVDTEKSTTIALTNILTRRSGPSRRVSSVRDMERGLMMH